MDRIVLNGMTFNGRHGVKTVERQRAQRFTVDIEVDADLSKPGMTDQLADTVDYSRVHAIAKEIVEGDSAMLIETLAHRIADRVLELPNVKAVSVRVAKRPVRMRPIDAAAVEIRRTRA